MKNMFRNLWNDDAGFIVSGEIVFLFTITVIGLVVGWVHVRGAMVSELTDVANAIAALRQDYAFGGIVSSCGLAGATGSDTHGSELIDSSPAALTVSRQATDPVTSSITPCLP